MSTPPRHADICCILGGIGRDEDLFEEPEKFWPDRFILSEYGTKPGADTTGCRETPFSFGGGRVSVGLLISSAGD